MEITPIELKLSSPNGKRVLETTGEDLVALARESALILGMAKIKACEAKSRDIITAAMEAITAESDDAVEQVAITATATVSFIATTLAQIDEINMRCEAFEIEHGDRGAR